MEPVKDVTGCDICCHAMCKRREIQKYKKKKILPNVLLVEIPSTLHLSVVRDIRSVALHTLSLTKLGLCLSFFGFYSFYKLLPLRIYHALCLELGTLFYLA